jgi:hypothetical protein
VILVVVDASVLVAELLRDRGRTLFRRPDLTVLVAEHQWEETQLEVDRRLGVLQSRGMSAARRHELEGEIRTLFAESCRLLRARGRLAARSRCRPHSLDEKLRARVGVGMATGGAPLLLRSDVA